MFQVNYTSLAENDLLAILDYITTTLKAPFAAENLLDEIDEQTRILEDTPFIFPLAKDGYINRLGIRHLTVKNYMVFYTIDETKSVVTIIRIMYARRDWVKLIR